MFPYVNFFGIFSYYLKFRRDASGSFNGVSYYNVNQVS